MDFHSAALVCEPAAAPPPPPFYMLIITYRHQRVVLHHACSCYLNECIHHGPRRSVYIFVVDEGEKLIFLSINKMSNVLSVDA